MCKSLWSTKLGKEAAKLRDLTYTIQQYTELHGDLLKKIYAKFWIMEREINEHCNFNFDNREIVDKKFLNKKIIKMSEMVNICINNNTSFNKILSEHLKTIKGIHEYTERSK